MIVMIKISRDVLMKINTGFLTKIQSGSMHSYHYAKFGVIYQITLCKQERVEHTKAPKNVLHCPW